MLKSTMLTRDDMDIKKFLRLRDLIRQNNKNYRPKKSAVLSWENITTFMQQAPDYIFLAAKVIYLTYLTHTIC